ncbi:uncharacterized protein GLRG_02464 [Colletotrichum graminicola M1.001]|uniref:Uncharacterized protein n=1 Tax=Colletotrichum graminicola (strain M1.001 / M2 / FGSC 10212) TaxID=645133 RepID=E3Q706_COLGM|nr:uncharacterized protein GLRG_02464 [Colletotrichum graminicola M1.001]EFQ26644.1 hypothetical protein GLRG_02464 [Colletotrichum graminicola M1.001]
MVTNQPWWVRIGGGACRRPKVIVGALILFLASWAIILNPDWHFTGSGLRMPDLHHRPASGPTDNPPTSPQPETEHSTEASVGIDGSRPRTAVLSPDTEGVLLSAAMPFFNSPSGRHSLVLQDDGDLVLNRMDADGAAHPVWWTGTGDKHSGGRMLIVEKQKDHFRLVVNAFLKNAWTMVWHSDLEPGCQVQKETILGRSSSDDQLHSTGLLEMTPGQLELSDQGKLSIAGACDLYVSEREREKERTLAVIVAGLYRTNHRSCKTHMEKLIAKHPSFTRIDVFAYVLFEPADINIHKRSEESIRAELRECYGSHLRTVDVFPVAQHEEDYPGGDKEMKAARCGKRLRRLNNQLKTVALAAERWWAWSIANGFIHDTVLRLRPDTLLKAEPEFKTVEELGQNMLVLPHPHGEHYFYCARMRGRIGVGPTDQIAYGSATAMSHWLYMYDRFHQMVALAGSPSGLALRDFSGCEEMPRSPLASDCPRPAPCSIECLVAWYLDARGVDFRIEWGWDHNLFRWKDIGPVGAEAERMADHDDEEDQDDGMVWP